MLLRNLRDFGRQVVVQNALMVSLSPKITTPINPQGEYLIKRLVVVNENAFQFIPAIFSHHCNE